MIHLTSEQVDQAVEALRSGGVIVFPTETSYGIGADATNEAAVARIFEIKKRDLGKALPILIPKGSAQNFVLVNDAAMALMSTYWPGPLNVILPVAADSPVASTCSSNGTQSVRESSHPFAATMVERFGRPVTATSANISGQDAIYSVEEVLKVFENAGEKPDFVVDAGALPPTPPSTTVLVEDDGFKVVREGSIKL